MSIVEVATAALIAGLLGSFHCAGMCGPLVTLGCAGHRAAKNTFGYFAGRILAYSTLGAIVGHLGKHALCILPVSAAHAAAVGLTALPAAARGIALLSSQKAPTDLLPLRKKPSQGLLSLVARVLPRRGLPLGLATGILPCGLLFTAFAMAAATASPGLGAASMVAFAIGSSPGLLLPVLGSRLAKRRGLRIPLKVEGLLWCALAVWLGVRLALGEQGCHIGAG